jgi:hypothetical protein
MPKTIKRETTPSDMLLDELTRFAGCSPDELIGTAMLTLREKAEEQLEAARVELREKCLLLEEYTLRIDMLDRKDLTREEDLEYTPLASQIRDLAKDIERQEARLKVIRDSRSG